MKCTYAEFLAGQHNTRVVKTFGEPVLEEALVLVRHNTGVLANRKI